MRILDINDNEVENPDLDLGHLELETIVTAHHPATDAVERQVEVVTKWVNPKDKNNKLIETVEIQPYISAKPAWDETERIQRYIPYTPEELAKREADRLAAEEARKEAEAEAKRQAELREKLKALPEQVESLEEAAAELGGVIGENDAILTQVQSDISDVMEAVAELGTLIVGEE